MRPVSPAFLRTVRGSHTMRSRARVCTTFQSGINPDGTEIPILDGDVRSEAKILGGDRVTGATVQASLDLTTDSGLWPYGTSDLLAPFGNEVYLERGIAFGNGTIEWVGLGYFRVDTTEQQTVPRGTVRVSASDRMAGLVDARLLSPRQYPTNTLLGDVVNDLVHEVYPDAVIEWDDDSDQAQLGRSLVAEEDRFGFLADLLTAVGKAAFWDYRGHLVIRAPGVTGQSVYTIDAGAGGVLIQLSRDLSREGVYNAVVAEGEAASTEPPVRGVATDDNPNSPTRWGGPFGRVPRFYSSPFITTTAQASSAAAAILRQSLGVPYNVDFGTIVNPALEVLDPVRVVYPGQPGKGARTEQHLIQSLTVPLTAGQAMTARTREQTLVVIGSA